MKIVNFPACEGKVSNGMPNFHVYIFIMYRISRDFLEVPQTTVGIGLELLLKNITDPASGRISHRCSNTEVHTYFVNLRIICEQHEKSGHNKFAHFVGNLMQLENLVPQVIYVILCI